ncbi:MAG TPA: hypothetical protein VGE07_09595, partial [Herpetosiphonaceae bacterium]
PPANTPTIPDWLRADAEPAGSAPGVEQPAPAATVALPEWLLDSPAPPQDGVRDLGERRQAPPAQDFSALRAELDEEPKKRGFFGRKK